jgi:hypothetical protein
MDSDSTEDTGALNGVYRTTAHNNRGWVPQSQCVTPVKPPQPANHLQSQQWGNRNVVNFCKRKQPNRIILSPFVLSNGFGHGGFGHEQQHGEYRLYHPPHHPNINHSSPDTHIHPPNMLELEALGTLSPPPTNDIRLFQNWTRQQPSWRNRRSGWMV